jgi:ECF transporter S component (folate family)
MISPTFSSGFFIAGGAVGVGNTCMDRSLPQKEDIFMKTSKKTMMTTRTLAYCALLASLSVILARLVIPMPNEFTRFSIEAVPIFLAGMLFGPLAGGMVGFTADFVGCLMFSLYGYNPIYCIPPILYGVCAGLFRHFLAKEGSLLRLAIAFLPPIVLGSIGIQSCVLSYMNYGIEAFGQGLIYFLSTRSIQFAVTMVLDVLVIYLLMRSNMFTRLGLWPPVRKENV